jgi:preprotein translocase subunit SecD
MSKRYRFFIVLLIMGICFIFLLPTLRWYFLVPAKSKVLALASREQIKLYASRTAQADVQSLVQLARDDAELPEKFAFLIPVAKSYNKLYDRQNPDRKSVV